MNKNSFMKKAIVSAILILALIVIASLLFNLQAAPAPELSAPDNGSGDSTNESTGSSNTSTNNSEGAISNYSLTLAPKHSADLIGTTHTVTATVTNNLNPVSGVSVAFYIASGPNMGLNGGGHTNSSGQVTFSWSSSVIGTDTVNATLRTGDQTVSDVATEEWIPRLNVIPEVPFGTIAISAAMLMGLSYFILKDKKTKF